MAKYTQREIEIHKQFLTIADMKQAANNEIVWETLRNALYGLTHYDSGKQKKIEALQQLRQLVKTKALNAIQVIDANIIKN